MRRLLPLIALLLLAGEARGEGERYFGIRVVDEATGRGVPMVEVKTTSAIRYVTDSAGWVAFDEPGLLGGKVFFHVSSHGYEMPKDGFGFRGVMLQTKPGGRAEIKIGRVNVAERLYRVTGLGIYRDSVLLGEPVPLKEPLLNGRVTGQDSVLCVPYRGRLFWIWGDTNRPRYPLGNFGASCAHSDMPGKGGLEPSVGVDLEYVVGDDGFSRPVVDIEGPGPRWLSGLMNVPDAEGHEQLFAYYARMKSLGEKLEHGIVRWNDERQMFERVVRFPLEQELVPQGHVVPVTVDGIAYLYFADPFPTMRVRADPAKVVDPAAYEPLEAEVDLLCVETGKAVRAHRGTVRWNAFRKCWIAIVEEAWGTSMGGEIWYAEAPSLLGPWVHARKVVTHDKMTFYNPVHHPWFDREGGRLVFFEGTYTHTFSGNEDRTPRYDYNQVMYRLDLADERLRLPPPDPAAALLDPAKPRPWPGL